ncbi:unnamed protein product [Dovyalis caffra]|uniref:Uncharacterized protein n=1 Tax=Dovyalis caffra TaxID=77055 RepID=A0AAV1SLN6_9ROSI|nr:unnamed protein product [Dovyalis caffra]
MDRGFRGVCTPDVYVFTRERSFQVKLGDVLIYGQRRRGTMGLTTVVEFCRCDFYGWLLMLSFAMVGMVARGSMCVAMTAFLGSEGGCQALILALKMVSGYGFVGVTINGRLDSGGGIRRDDDGIAGVEFWAREDRLCEGPGGGLKVE